MKFLRPLLVGAAVAVLAGAALAQEPIKIGGAFNLTGALASLDVPAANGAKLAVKEINAAGGVLGRPLELVVYDGKTDPATITNIATQMISGDHVVAITGFTDSDSALALGPIAQRNKIPFVTAGATSPLLPTQIGDYMFLEPFGDNVQAAVGAEFAMKKWGNKAYLLYDKATEYTNLLAGYFKDAFTHAGGQVLLEDSYKSGDTSYSAQITKLKALSTQPDFLYISAMPDDIGTIVKQVRQAGVNLPIVGGDGYDTPLLVQVAGPASNDVYFTTHALMTMDSTPAVAKFIQAYNAEYGKDPENAFAALGYDSVHLIANAITQANSTDPTKIRDALQATTDLPGVTGAISYVDGKRVPQKQVTVIGVKDQKLYLAAQEAPSYIPTP
jgi:branched-chain amino acid transport system substrate-binding protein